MLHVVGGWVRQGRGRGPVALLPGREGRGGHRQAPPGQGASMVTSREREERDREAGRQSETERQACRREDTNQAPTGRPLCEKCMHHSFILSCCCCITIIAIIHPHSVLLHGSRLDVAFAHAADDRLPACLPAALDLSYYLGSFRMLLLPPLCYASKLRSRPPSFLPVSEQAPPFLSPPRPSDPGRTHPLPRAMPSTTRTQAGRQEAVSPLPALPACLPSLGVSERARVAAPVVSSSSSGRGLLLPASWCLLVR